jgi:hypothetical protein
MDEKKLCIYLLPDPFRTKKTVPDFVGIYLSEVFFAGKGRRVAHSDAR